MTSWRVLLLVAIVADYLVRLWADVANLRALRTAPPPELAALYDDARYARGQEYTRVRTYLGIVTSTVHLLALLLFWWSGGFGWWDRWTRALGWSEIPTGLMFLAGLMVASGVIGLPFRWYATFVIEARYGFNRATQATFWRDLLVGMVLAASVGGVAVAAVLWLFQTAGAGAWLWCWAALTAWTVLLQYVAPTWIMPLFNRFTTLPEGALRDGLLALAARLDFPMAGVWVIDGSRRSSKANAFFTGFGARKRIALFDTLLATLSPDEIVAVVAHEIGHYKRHHVQWGLALAILQLGLLCGAWALLLHLPELSQLLFIDTASVHAALILFALLSTPLDLPIAYLGNARSRRQEYEADRFAADALHTGTALASGLKRLAADTLTNLTPHPLYVALHYSHPPLRERIRALERA